LLTSAPHTLEIDLNSDAFLVSVTSIVFVVFTALYAAWFFFSISIPGAVCFWY